MTFISYSFDEIDDHMHMLSDDDSDPEPIMPGVIYEMSGVTLGPRTPAPFRLVPEAALHALMILRLWTFSMFSEGVEWMQQPPPAAVRPVEGTSAPEDVRAEDDEILRQLRSTQACISIWSLLASSSTHRDALIWALSQIRVETTTSPRD
ncbi:hypothetical protein CK203_048275 [Vitis vinifera]|uniref:Uncharacterized protein n=1 Tax=Vitis vinifera TaxID=29760 RepID=A0A438H049_VITVI|nr:hypothetical protein CK203_048275 [Vitis vinifera]